MAKMSGVIDLSMSVPLTQFSVASSAGGGDYDEASFDSFSYSTTCKCDLCSTYMCTCTCTYMYKP